MTLQPTLDQTIEQVITAIHQLEPTPSDVMAVRHALAAHPQERWPAVAAGARAVWKHELTAGGDAARALRAALAASTVYAIVGDDAASLRADYDALQIRFMAADDVMAYGAVQRDAVALAHHAQALTLADLRFNAATTAADSAYFAVGCADSTQKGTILDALLGHLITACDAARAYPDRATDDPAGFAKFVSLVADASNTLDDAVLVHEMPSARGPDGALSPAFVQAMHQLATGVEDVVPADYVHTLNGTSDPDASALIAQRLAQLSTRHGSTKCAQARLHAALVHDTDDDDA